jgi:hypothetical protein
MLDGRGDELDRFQLLLDRDTDAACFLACPIKMD